MPAQHHLQLLPLLPWLGHQGRRALAAAPELLLLDEPLASLDAGAAQALHQVLQAHHLSMLLVSHDPADVAALADRVLVLGGSPTVIRDTILVDPTQRERAAQRLIG